MITDPIADYLTCIRNALKARHRVVQIPSSSLKKAITKVLHEQGYIRKYEFENQPTPQGAIHIYLKYDKETGEPAIQYIKRISTPGKRKYTKVADLPHVLDGFGIGIISTPQGIMTDKEARKRNVGGEELCHIH